LYEIQLPYSNINNIQKEEIIPSEAIMNCFTNCKQVVRNGKTVPPLAWRKKNNKKIICYDV
jgi:hypothetical protein